MRICFLLLILGAVLLGGCRKDIDDITGGGDPVTFVRSSFYGVVTGPQDQPLAGVLVARGTYSTTTDENGYFFLPEAPVDSRGAILRFTSPGYFELVRTALPLANRATPVEVQLSLRALSGTVSAMQGGTVTFGGAEVVLPAQGFVLANGQAYSGQVQVYATFLDPASPDMQRRMPGNLSAVRADGRGAVLATFGMIGVELATPAGEPLQLAPGSTATIRVPLAPDFRAAAPATIPLWHFDEEKGRWIEEGQASLNGNVYVGEVSHFSFWNCDIPFDAVILKGRVIAEGGSPVMHARVRATVLSGGGGPLPDGAMALAYTDVDGQFTGWVPAGAVLKVEVLSSCNQVIETVEVGPLSSDFDLGTILVEWNSDFLMINAQLRDCDDKPLKKPGYLRLKAADHQLLLPADDNGQVAGLLLVCGAAQLVATAFDPINLKQGQEEVFPISGLSSLDLGTLTACEDLTEFLNYDLGGLTGTLLQFWGGVDNNVFFLNAYGPDSTNVSISAFLTQPSAVFAQYVSVFVYDAANMDYLWATCGTPCGSIVVNVTELGNVGEMIKGTFAGTIDIEQGNSNVPLNGTFQFIRTN